MRQSENRVQLELSDDGRGFDPAGTLATPGIGLKNMRERVELLGGQFELHSAPGQGTTFLLTLPTANETLVGHDDAPHGLLSPRYSGERGRG